jgi:hypothetical protein
MIVPHAILWLWWALAVIGTGSALERALTKPNVSRTTALISIILSIAWIVILFWAILVI